MTLFNVVSKLLLFCIDQKRKVERHFFVIISSFWFLILHLAYVCDLHDFAVTQILKQKRNIKRQCL